MANPRPQSGILASCPPHARHMLFRLLPDADPKQALSLLTRLKVDRDLVVGIGAPLAAFTKLEVAGLRTFPAFAGAAVAMPSTQQALWCWLRGDDRGDLVHRGHALIEHLFPAFEVADILDTFVHVDSRDLTGYIDGTENPTGKKADAAAFTKGGGSFVAVQTWLHDLDRFLAFPESERDAIIGRRHSDNQEIASAPASAHVKRAAQETFKPPAFMVRRSMPWSTGEKSGLQFVAFGRSLDLYEAVLRRMLGLEDGIVDGLFRFSRPLTGGYYWCPPCLTKRLQLR